MEAGIYSFVYELLEPVALQPQTGQEQEISCNYTYRGNFVSEETFHLYMVQKKRDRYDSQSSQQ